MATNSSLVPATLPALTYADDDDHVDFLTTGEQLIQPGSPNNEYIQTPLSRLPTFITVWAAIRTTKSPLDYMQEVLYGQL